jgi:hypothetical protein
VAGTFSLHQDGCMAIRSAPMADVRPTENVEKSRHDSTCSVLTLTAKLSVAVITDATILDPWPFIPPVLYQWLIQCHSVFRAIITENATAFATVMLACENAEFRVALVACMNFGVLLPHPVFYHQRRQRRRSQQAEF